MSTSRDIFADLFTAERPDPIAAVRRTTRPPLPRRFYRQAQVDAGAEGFRILLDDRPVRTPARRPLIVPSRALAQALAAEWDAQGETIDPATMPLTRLANSILDGVVAAPAAVAAEIEKFLGSDLLFYRADGPQGLVERQARHWDPVLAWARATLGAQFVLAQGIVHAPQPQGAIAKARAAIPGDPWRLGAVHVITTLTGSALIALALLHGRLTVAEAWGAAHVDEDWNLHKWGRDEVALQRRAAHFAEMQAAATVLQMAG
jgi:chaperone required for assembly of F1-ATPase